MLDAVRPPPRVLALHAHDFEGMFSDLRELGCALGVDSALLERELRARIGAVTRRARGLRKKKVFCMEWLDPLFTSGHWVPEMVAMAGGVDRLAPLGKDSRRVGWAELTAYAPEVLILMPCGFTMKRTKAELGAVTSRPEWAALPAVRAGEAYLADGPSYFNGAGPRLVRGLEILAEILHPRTFRRTWRGYERLTNAEK